MSYRTILVTGANGDIADGVLRILGESLPRVRLVGADTTDEWPGRAHVAEMHRLPFATMPSYLDALRSLMTEVAADLVIPVHEHEMRRVANDWIEVADLPFLINPPDIILRFLDKLETARWLSSIGIAVPATRPLDQARPEHLPLVVKPRFASGSRLVTIVASSGLLAALQAQTGPEMVAQELLDQDDAEFTCVICRPAGRLMTLTMRRRLAGGLTSQIRIERHAAIDAMLRAIADALPAFLTLNVQLRLTSDGPRIFEINPRFSSTVMLRHRIGFQDLLWACRARTGEAIPATFEPPVGARVFRRFSELVVRE